MQVNASPLQTYLAGSARAQELLRLKQAQQAAAQEKNRQSEQQAAQSQPVQISDAAYRVAARREVVSLERAEKSQRNYDYYPFPDHQELSAFQQKALQTYSNNQHLSRSDSSGDFLGSVDVFA